MKQSTATCNMKISSKIPQTPGGRGPSRSCCPAAERHLSDSLHRLKAGYVSGAPIVAPGSWSAVAAAPLFERSERCERAAPCESGVCPHPTPAALHDAGSNSKPLNVCKAGAPKILRGCLLLVLLLLPLCFAGILPAAVISYTHDGAGRLTGVDYGGGRGLAYTYDDAGNLTQKAVLAPFPDSDGDGMDDAWELEHFGTLDRDGTGDFDGDGLLDLHEFLAGTDPTDPDSALTILPGAVVGEDGVTIEWQSVPGKTYRVQFKDSLDAQEWQDVAGDVTADGATAGKIDPTGSAQPHRFYRVLLVQ